MTLDLLQKLLKDYGLEVVKTTVTNENRDIAPESTLLKLITREF